MNALKVRVYKEILILTLFNLKYSVSHFPLLFPLPRYMYTLRKSTIIIMCECYASAVQDIKDHRP